MASPRTHKEAHVSSAPQRAAQSSAAHQPRPPPSTRMSVGSGRNTSTKRAAKAATQEYWSIYQNMKGMAAYNNKHSPRRRDVLPLPDPPDLNLIRARAPAYSIGSALAESPRDGAPGPGAYTPRLPASAVSPRFQQNSYVNIARAGNPGPGTYDPVLPLAQTARIAPPPTEAIMFTEKRHPGPADYSTPPHFGKTGLAFSFGTRSKEGQVTETRAAFAPGPGAYDVPSGLGKKGFSLSGRLPEINERHNPGPGAYDLPSDFNPSPRRGITIKGREALDRSYPD